MKAAYGDDSMPSTGENVAQEFQVSRADQDAFALRSQEKAAAAQANGRLAAEIVAVEIPQRKGDPVVVDKDEHPRATTLRGAWQAEADRPRRRHRDRRQCLGRQRRRGGDDHRLGRRGQAQRPDAAARACSAPPSPACRRASWASGPRPASEKLMKRLGLKIGDFDVIELNEAFAAQGLAVLRQLGLADDAPQVNPNGGAIALGHPLGMSGARLALTATEELQRSGGKLRARHHVHRRRPGNRARARDGCKSRAMSAVATKVDEAAIMAVLEDIPDPEIPVLTITDLGIVRGFVDDPPRVRISPTYTGCPATVAIEMSIREALDKAGFGDVHIERVLFPPWTTDWITQRGRERLHKLRDRAAKRFGHRGMPAMRLDRNRGSQPLRLNPVQGPVALHSPAWSRSTASSATKRVAITTRRSCRPSVRKIGLRQRCRSLSASRTAASSMSTPRPGPSGTGR